MNNGLFTLTLLITISAYTVAMEIDMPEGEWESLIFPLDGIDGADGAKASPQIKNFIPYYAKLNNNNEEDFKQKAKEDYEYKKKRTQELDDELARTPVRKRGKVIRDFVGRNGIDAYWNYPLRTAVIDGNRTLVKELLSLRADPNQGSWGNIPKFSILSLTRDRDIIALLKEAGAR